MKWIDFSGMIEMINKGDFYEIVSKRRKVQTEEKRQWAYFSMSRTINI